MSAVSGERRVLSIQSQVVHGYVGNSCATFPLQLLGFDVCCINSVHFSNHKGYKHCTGRVFTAADVDDLFEGLKGNSLLSFSHVLTGFIGEPTFLLKVCDIIEELKRRNPGLVYVCDPVMGDNGRMYVPKELLPIYINRVLPLADVIVPNQLEAELLTDRTISTEADAIAVMSALHQKGPKTVIISSTELGEDDFLMVLASTFQGSHQSRYRMRIPRIRGLFVGTGDLFAALILAWQHTHQDLQVALEKTISTMQNVIRRTLNSSLECCEGSANKPTAAQMELRLVQSKGDIEHPTVFLKAELIQT